MTRDPINDLLLAPGAMGLPPPKPLQARLFEPELAQMADAAARIAAALEPGASETNAGQRIAAALERSALIEPQLRSLLYLRVALLNGCPF